MSLERALLQKLSEWRPDSGRQTLSIADDGDGWTAEVAADRCDELSCLVWEVTLRRTAGSLAPEALRGWADRVADRVSGLGQPLKIVEVDTSRAVAQLRSDEPVARGEHVLYYEAMLTGTGEATLRRYQLADEPKERRRQVSFALTHETLAQVADEMRSE